MQVSEVLRVKGNTLFTVTPETMLSDCVVTMAQQDIGSLVVMDHGKLVGMLTFREVLRVLARPAATLRASRTLVARGVGLMDSRARPSARRSSVKVCSTRAASEKLTTMAESPEVICSSSVSSATPNPSRALNARAMRSISGSSRFARTWGKLSR